MIAVDLFAGAGGMSLGAQSVGIDVRVAVECDKWAAATYAYNHPNTKVINDDIANVRLSDLPETTKTKILFGGPPCQGFSTSNQRTRSRLNPRNWLFKEFIRILGAWKPDWVVFENVNGLRETEKGMFLDFILSEFAEKGYTTSCWTLNAVEHGVPQRRYRLFVVGSREGISVDPPEPLADTQVTAGEAIADLPLLDNGASEDRLSYRCKPLSAYAEAMRASLTNCTNHLVTCNNAVVMERYRHIPQGGNWEHVPEHLMDNYTNRTRCHTGIYYRLREDAPSLVVGNFRKNMLIHPTQHRGLSVREAARLQSFPDNYVFSGSIGFQQQQVGNAVPPLLAAAVFESIKEAT